MNLTHPDMAGDFHRYATPDGFVDQFGLFDHIYHHTLIGEYACVYPNNVEGLPSRDKFITYPFWIGSVAETVFLLVAERNSDRIIGAAYAPLMAHFEESQWVPTLLTFTADPKKTTLSTSYHAIQLLASNTLTETLHARSDAGFGPLYYVTGRDNDTDSYLFKAAVYNSTSNVPVSISFPSFPKGTRAEHTVLTAEAPDAHNAVGGREAVISTTSIILAGPDGVFSFELPNLSVAVLRAGKAVRNKL